MMQININETEMEAINKVLAACNTIKNLQHNTECDYSKDTEYHLEVRFTGIGTTLHIVVPEFNVRKDITDYASF